MTERSLKSAFRQPWQWLAEQAPADCSAAGWRAFQTGLFLMPSSAFMGGVLLLMSLTLWKPTAQPRPLHRPIARLLLSLAALMVVTTIAAAPSLTLEQRLRVMNWLPFFWFFLAIRPYLTKAEARNRVAMAVVGGTVPIAILGLAQAKLAISGPWEALGGLLMWDLPSLYQSRGAGVFPNPNFTAAWYVTVLPLAAAQMLRWRSCNGQEGELILRRLSVAVLMLIAISLYVCASRNALLIAPAGLLALSWQTFALPLLLIYGGITGLLALALWGERLGGLARMLAEASSQFTGYLAPKFKAVIEHRKGTTADPLRQELYPKALEFIHAHPWLGGGERLLPGSPESLSEPSGLTHLHSLPLQFAINHGLPGLIVLTALVGWLAMKAMHRVYLSNRRTVQQPSLIDRSMVIAGLTAIWLHVLDIPSFDSRINVLGWVVLASMWTIGQEPPRVAGQNAAPADP